ncbi:uncharacterized protein si:ch211-51h4.2 isoform X2 [Heterodontus francisci]|uniref:uncharacterized protein si:ch211-51h4.2 isoform X2 n=1 Tax=Heterodontus francisci TaxID=7792 RepID=UPI00355C5F65
MASEQRQRTSSRDTYMPLSLKSTMKNEDRPWKLRLIYLQCYFISIACILGTGILGLPGTVAHAGLQPFLVSFITGFFMQVLLIYLFVDLLQRCRLAQVDAAKHLRVERIIMQDVGDQDPIPSSIEEEEEIEDADHVLLHQNNGVGHSEEEQMPNLHILGVLFLNKYMSCIFNLLIILQFISIGISYVLAGSEAFAELLQIRHVYVIPFFTWILSLGIILAQVIIQPITSILTLVKGTLLIITVIVTFVVGSEVHQEITNDFSSIGTPFLMGTVALGGIVNVMPMLFSEISQNRSQVMWFRRAVIGGLTTCAILNILWCWAVLNIVPQTSVRKVLFDGDLNTSMPDANQMVPGYIIFYSNISLEASEKAGEIATVPLTRNVCSNRRLKSQATVKCTYECHLSLHLGLYQVFDYYTQDCFLIRYFYSVTSAWCKYTWNFLTPSDFFFIRSWDVGIAGQASIYCPSLIALEKVVVSCLLESL